MDINEQAMRALDILECSEVLHEFEGDHFFIREHENEILSLICRDLAAWVSTLERCA